MRAAHPRDVCAWIRGGARHPVAVGLASVRVLLLLLDDDDYRSSRRALAGALVSRGDDVYVMASLGSEPLDAGVIAIPWSIDRGGLDPRRELRAIAEVIAAYARVRPDPVHHVPLQPA